MRPDSTGIPKVPVRPAGRQDAGQSGRGGRTLHSWTGSGIANLISERFQKNCKPPREELSSRQRMNRFLQKGRAVICFLAVVFAGNPSLSAQPATNEPPAPHRWLFIIETSGSMRPRASATMSMVEALLTTGMRGELKPGDSLGFWTYNQALYTGQMPLQDWSSVSASDIMLSTLSFLNKQHYEKHGNLDAVMPAMTSVIKRSEFLTIVLLSDGAGKISGTPFDDAINAAQQGWQKDEQHNKQPIVTILRAQKGVVTAWTVTPSPWAVEIPPLPPEPKIVQAPAPTPPKPRPPPVIPSLYMSGRKPAANTNSDQPNGTNFVPAGQTTNGPAKTPGSSSTVVPDNVPVAVAPTNVPPPDAALSATAQPGVPNSVTAVNSTTTGSVSTATANSAADVAAATPDTIRPAETHPVPTAQPTASIAPPATPLPATPPANSPTSQTAASATSGASPPVASASVPTAVAVPDLPGGGGSSIWTIGLAVAGAGAAAVVLLLIRARPKPQLSSITRSLEQEKRR